MRKKRGLIGILIVSIIVSLCGGSISSKAVETAPPSGYVEVPVKKGEMIYFDKVGGYKILTTANNDNYYTTYSYGSLYLQNTKQSYDKYSDDDMFIETEYDVKFYVPESYKENYKIMKGPIFTKKIVKPGESYNCKNESLDEYMSISLSYDKILKEKSTNTLFDQIQYGKNGEIQQYIEQNININHSTILPGESISFTNSTKEDQIVLLPNMAKYNLTSLKEPILHRFTVKPRTVIEADNPKFEGVNIYPVSPYRISTNNQSVEGFTSISYDKNGINERIGVQGEVVNGLKTRGYVSGYSDVSFYTPKELKDNIKFGTSMLPLTMTKSINPGETFEIVARGRNKTLFASEIKENNWENYQILNYDKPNNVSNANVFYNDVFHGSQSTTYLGLIRNTSKNLIYITFPAYCVGETNVSTRELFSEITLKKGVNYRIGNTENTILEKVNFQTDSVYPNGKLLIGYYNNLGEKYRSEILNFTKDSVPKYEKVIILNDSKEDTKMYVPLECKNDVSVVEDVNNSNTIDIADIAQVALSYNKKLDYNSTKEFIYDITNDGFIDIYDIVAVATKI